MTDSVFHIRNYHLDGYGHVNNARYLELMEEARWHFFERHNLLDGLGGIQIVVARADIRYLRGATAKDTIRIRSLIIKLRPRLLVVRQTAAFAHNGKAAAQADISLVPAAEGGSSTDWPPAVFAQLTALQTAAL